MVVTAQNTPQDFVDAHNVARANVGVGPVSWDETVAAWAEAYVELRRVDCEVIHSSEGRPCEENLFGGSGVNWTAADAVKVWVSEKQYYDHNNNTCSSPAGESCGHYTQVVWCDSTAIGCARVVCDGGDGVGIICSYNPPSNWEGQSPY